MGQPSPKITTRGLQKNRACSAHHSSSSPNQLTLPSASSALLAVSRRPSARQEYKVRSSLGRRRQEGCVRYGTLTRDHRLITVLPSFVHYFFKRFEIECSTTAPLSAPDHVFALSLVVAGPLNKIFPSPVFVPVLTHSWECSVEIFGS